MTMRYETWLERAQGRYGDRFDYSKAERLFTGYLQEAEITVICRKHGKFGVTPFKHLQWQGGCKRCPTQKLSGDKVPHADWLQKCKEKFGDKYDYSETHKGWRGSWRTTIKLHCRFHGPFEIIAGTHLASKRGCTRCLDFSIPFAEFLKRAHKKYGTLRFDYSEAERDFETLMQAEEVTIKCGLHGEFRIRPTLHLRTGQGCQQCNDIYRPIKNRINISKKPLKVPLEVVKERIIKVHGDHFDFTDSNFVNVMKRFTVRCTRCDRTLNKALPDYINAGCRHCSRDASPYMRDRSPANAIDHFKAFPLVDAIVTDAKWVYRDPRPGDKELIRHLYVLRECLVHPERKEWMKYEGLVRSRRRGCRRCGAERNMAARRGIVQQPSKKWQEIKDRLRCAAVESED